VSEKLPMQYGAVVARVYVDTRDLTCVSSGFLAAVFLKVDFLLDVTSYHLVSANISEALHSVNIYQLIHLIIIANENIQTSLLHASFAIFHIFFVWLSVLFFPFPTLIYV
jgi:hypothetical protein